MKTYTAIVASALIVVSTINMVTAKPEYVNKIPNGSKIGQSLGHVGTSSERNAFGEAFAQAGLKWDAICRKTFPGALITAGQALGDPCCKWEEGGTPQFEVSWTTDPGKGTTCPHGSLNKGATDSATDTEEVDSVGGKESTGKYGATDSDTDTEEVDSVGGKESTGEHGATDSATDTEEVDSVGGKESTGEHGATYSTVDTDTEEVDSVGGKEGTGEHGATYSTVDTDEVDSVGGKEGTGEHGASNEAGGVAGLLATDSAEEPAETKGTDSAEGTGEHGSVAGLLATDSASGLESALVGGPSTGEDHGESGVEPALDTSLLPPLDSTDPYGKGPPPSGGGCAAKRARKLRY